MLPVLTLPTLLALTVSSFAAARSSSPLVQDSPAAGDAVARATPEARELWQRVCAASGSASRAPLSAFQIEAEVLTRQGSGTNEGRIDYRYLAPDCIRFMLPSKNTTGRFGPAPEEYWLQSHDGVVVLAGREYKEDRKHVDDMLALARNYVALSNPARLDLRALELVQPPPDLPPELAKRARKLTWIALESADFALVRSDVERAIPDALYRVELGVRGEDGLPAFAIVRALGESPRADPLLVEFSDYQPRDDFKLPAQIKVHVFERSKAPLAFTEKPSQEVYVTSVSLRPSFTAEDFQPKKPKK